MVKEPASWSGASQNDQSPGTPESSVRPSVRLSGGKTLPWGRVR